MPLTHFDMECGPKCRSERHAQDLNAAITRGSLREIQAYFRLCHNAGCMSDTFRRTALHLAASCGKCDVVQWLLTAKKADVAAKDEESGWTALHRAIFYGQLGAVRILLQEMPDLTVRDREGLGPLDIIQKDRPGYVTFSSKGQNEVYSWGDNSNLTLGHSVEQRRPVPEAVDTFRKLQLNVQQVVLCKYHTVFLTACGKVLTCGHGQGGRLGHNDELTCLIPRVVEAIGKEICVHVAAARDHTVFLMQGGSVYTCGLNDSHQLGQFPSPQKSLAPKLVNHKVLKGKRIGGVCAGRFHTVVTTSDTPNAVYTFGLNAGQLGHPKGDVYQSQPRQVAYLNHENFSLQTVACSDAAVVCLTSQGDIYVLHEYQCRRIASKWLDITKIEVSGGHLDHQADRELLREYGGTELTIALLHSTGKVFLWRQSSPTVKRCHWAIRRPLVVSDMALSSQSLVVVTEDGEGFVGHASQRRAPAQPKQHETTGGDNFAKIRLMDLLLKDEVEEVQVHRIPLIFRATRVSTDRKGRNYVVTQATPNSCLTDVPSVSSSSMVSDLRVLLEEADQGDTIHDVLIKVGHDYFPAHKYILAYRSEHFKKLFSMEEDKEAEEVTTEIVLDDDVHPAIFRQLLQFIYTDTCDLLQVGSRFELMQVPCFSARNDIFDFEPHFGVSDTSVVEKSLTRPEAGQKTKAKRKKKNGLKNQLSSAEEKKPQNGKSPVKMLQDLAKRYSIKALSKRLESVKIADGIVQSTGKFIPKANLKFDRKKLASLYDVAIEGEDGHVVQCHKCIAVARLEYFHSMMARGWIETSNTAALSLPIPGDYLETILDFLYAGDAPGIRGCTDIERLCNVLVVADQLLITALKEICEAALASLLTLRNAGDMLEFASMYNASQLRATCQQYICLNLATVLEARGLQVLSDDVMTELTQYYRNMVPAMCRRQITPYDEGPGRDYLEALAADYHSEGDEEFGAGDNAMKKPKPKKKRGRQKSVGEEGSVASCGTSLFGRCTDRQTSISSETSAKSEEEEMGVMAEEQLLQVKPSGDHRITSVRPAHRRAEISPWNMASSPPLSELSAPDTSQTGVSLRGIMTQEGNVQKQDGAKSASVGIKKSTKLSQKERKKLLSAKSQGPSAVEASHCNGPTSSPWGGDARHMASSGKTPWGGVSHVVQSFRDLMLEDKELATSTPVATGRGTGPSLKTPTSPIAVSTSARGVPPSLKSPTSPSSGSIISWGLPTSSVQRGRSASTNAAATPISPSSPTDNPWLRKTPPSASASLSFSEIVRDEIQRQDNLVRNTNKPLGLIQIEERAIQELLHHYRAEENVDEHITVERVWSAAATPLWAVDRK